MSYYSLFILRQKLADNVAEKILAVLVSLL